MLVSTQDLVALGACAPEVREFERTFGASAEASGVNIALALAAGLNVEWWILKVFGEAWREKVRAMLRECFDPRDKRITAEKWARYREMKFQAMVGVGEWGVG